MKVRIGLAVLVTAGVLQVLAPSPAFASVVETTGSVTHTWTNYSNAGGYEGPTIPTRTSVEITCKLTGFKVANGNTWWYQIGSSPWSNKYYASADAFYNNGATSGSLLGTPYVDTAVPDCGSAPVSPPTPAPAPQSTPPAPTPTPTPSVVLAQGPTAPSGYRYALNISGFAGNSSVSINCRDSVSSSGFYTFALKTDGNGRASTASACYSADGPDHWVIANGSIESNHVRWTVQAPTARPSPPPGPTPAPVQAAPSSGSSETCEVFSGEQAPASGVSDWLFGHFEGGYSSSVVIPWSYFSGNPQFVEKAKSLKVGEEVNGWRAVFPSDMYFALGGFTIKRTGVLCYSIRDTYDFSALFLPFWLQQRLKSAIPFEVRSSGKLD